MKRDQTTSYTKTSFDEFYQRKLEALKVQLKGIIYDIPFVVSQEFACWHCGSRIKLHTNGHILCLMCEPLPLHWSKEMQERVCDVLRGYPDINESVEAWRKSLPEPEPEPRPRDLASKSIGFGARVEEARQALGWTSSELASKIFRKDGGNIAASTVGMIEKGQGCSAFVREQLEKVLGLQEGVAV
jgi:hypothetical protein